MHDREWEAVINTARRLERIADNCAGEECWDRLRAELDAIVARFDCHPADDLPARGLLAICHAWLAQIDAEEQDQEWRDGLADDEDCAEAHAD